jgi:mRNA interferase RelE/StbE
MAVYKVYFKESVEKDLESIPKKTLNEILRRISLLSQEPRPFGSEKLSDQERYRIRQGNYRVVYSIQDDELTVWIVKVGNRKEIYRRRK